MCEDDELDERTEEPLVVDRGSEGLSTDKDKQEAEEVGLFFVRPLSVAVEFYGVLSSRTSQNDYSPHTTRPTAVVLLKTRAAK